MAKAYVKFQTPKEIADKLINVVSVAKDTGRIRRGTNEATKAVESQKAEFVVIAEDVEPEEIVMHLPLMCEEKGIPYAFVPSKLDLGKASGLNVQCAAIAIENAGGAKEALHDVVSRLGQKAKGAERKEAPKPAAPAKEEKPKKERKPKKE